MRPLARSLAIAASLAALASPAAAEPPAPTSPAPAPGATAKLPVDFRYERFELANGLEVLVHEDHRTPVVAVNLWYHVGSKDEAAGRSGFAHLFEHLMFQGSRHVGEDMFFQYLERAGASERNGTTGTDRTNYFETVPSNQLELALWLESDRMAYLLDHVDEETFAGQREVVKNERRQRYENAPYGLVGQFVREAMYPADHPYRHLPIGTPEDLDAAKLEDVRQFFRTFYVPNDATLVLAGDIDPARARALVEQWFGPIPRGAEPPIQRTAAPVAIAAEKRLAIAANVELPRVSLSWHAPAAFAPGTMELELLSALLTNGKSSRLHKKLVYDLQLAQSVSAWLSDGQLGSTFEIVATLKKGKSPEEALAAIDAVLDEVRTTAPSIEEMTRARAATLAAMVFPLERVGARANWLNYAAQLAQDPGVLPRLVDRVQNASPGDVLGVAQGWLAKDRRVVAIVRPDPAAPRAGRLVEGS
jgi:predicted Zn-dependent peptidase